MADLAAIERALRAADAAGNVEDARRLAQAYKAAQASQEAPKADFSQVAQASGSSAAVGAGRKPARQYASGAGLSLGHVDSMGAPTLEQINAENAKRTPEDRRRAQLAGRRASFEQMNPLTRFVYGAGRAVDKTVRGIGQLAHDAGDAVLGGDMGARMRAEETQRRKDEAIVTDGYAADDVGEFAGNVALWAAPASKVAGLNTLGARVAGNAALGGSIGALAPVQTGESRLANMAIGAGAGVAGQAAGAGLQRLGANAAKAISPEVRSVATKAKAHGIDLMPWQLSDNTWLARARGVTNSLPFTGGKQRVAAQSSQFQRAAAKQIGETLGEGEVLNPSIMGRAYTRLGQGFDDALSGGANADRQFLRDVVQVKNDAANGMSDNAIRGANAFVDRLRRQVGSGQLSGKQLQSLDRQARLLEQSADPDTKQVGQWLRESLHGAFRRSAPPDKAAAFDTLRRQYAIYKTYEPVIARQGELVPQQLKGAVNANAAGRSRMARDAAGEVGDLARIGSMMKPAQTSGTAENLFAGGAGMGLIAEPTSALSALVSGNITARALDSNALARYMLRQNPGSLRGMVGKQLPFLGLGAVPVAAQAYDP